MDQDSPAHIFLLSEVDHQQLGCIVADISRHQAYDDSGYVSWMHAHERQDNNSAPNHPVDYAHDCGSVAHSELRLGFCGWLQVEHVFNLKWHSKDSPYQESLYYQKS